MPRKRQATSSRFQIHDDLTAPEGSLPILKGALATGGQLPNFLGVLAGSPAALRAYARFRSELRHGELSLVDAGADRARGGRALRLGAGHRAAQRGPRAAGLGIDEVALAREWDSKRRARSRAAALPRPWSAGRAPMHLHEEAREAGWSDEQILEAIAYVALESFTAMINVAGDVPVDGSVEEPRRLRAA